MIYGLPQSGGKADSALSLVSPVLGLFFILSSHLNLTASLAIQKTTAREANHSVP
ncbi:Uncharacterized protein YP598_0623 [Yersinia pseudotuberculosis]|uniref:Uncharacterized protein n=1 Tax=Yersinia pseudotuberculosis serotype O:1b (strain IP 31758) TaxID=349747 RepID=A0A0U1R2Q4_YERP3|nr:hypothetical protein YpsIP31758_0606 [Yersinia pseudotuberculosis IP 31758]UFA60250.1 Uncharacterized protein YP598_0623 [Yersinia pseudotuberculosis]